MSDYDQFQKLHHLFRQGKYDEGLQVLMQLQARYIASQDNAEYLKTRLEELETIIALSKGLSFDAQFYWIKLNGVTYGPFCPICRERDGTLFRLQRHGDVYDCPYCGAEYLTAARAVGDTTANHSHVRQAKVLPFVAVSRRGNVRH